MPQYFYNSGTKKQTRKYQKIKQEYKTKKNQIQNIRDLLKKNKKSMAKSCMDNYIKENGEDGYILHELGKYYSYTSELDLAKKYFEKVIDNNYKNKYYSMYELAKIEKNYGNLDKSLTLLNQIIDSNHTEKCHAKLEKAKILYIMGKYEESLNGMMDLILANESNKVYAFDAIIDYAVDFFDCGLAKRTYKIVKKDLTEDGKIYYSAIINKLEKDLIKSKGKFEKLSTVDGEFKYRAKYHLAIINFELENYHETIELAEEVSNNYEVLTPCSYRLLANTYMLIDEEKVLYYIEKLKNYGDSQKSAINNLYGSLYFNKRDYKKALEYFYKVDSIQKAIYYDTVIKIGYIYIKTKQYEKALEYFNEMEKIINSDNFNLECQFAKTFLQKQLNLEITYDSDLYSVNQIVEYSREKAIEHIKSHTEANKDKKVHSVFSSNIDLEKLYDYALSHINEETFYYNNFMDIYLLEYPNVGISRDKKADYIIVVTLPNSKDIITMYPHDKQNVRINRNTPKVKKMSRIDKFNQKYGM